MHEDIIRRLRETPAALRAVTRGRRGEALTAAAPDGWAPIQVILHIRASAAIQVPRIYQALVRERPQFSAFDERAWADLLALPQVPLDAQLTAFQIERAELVGVLSALSPDAWQRSGVHESAGEQTVLTICGAIADHEEEHLIQLRALLEPTGR